MPTGNPFEAFSDFMVSTPKSQASGIDEFAVYLPEKTWILNGLNQHGNMEERFFAGTSITDQFIPDVQSTGMYRRPNGAATFSMPQHFQTWISYPSMHLDAVTWTAYELEQSRATKDLRGKALRKIFKRLKEKKFRVQRIGQAKQFEGDLLAAPDYAEMEGPNAFKPRSIFCYVNEGMDVEWTTLQGITRTAVPQFAPERVAVNYATNQFTSNWQGFLGMDILMANIERERIPMGGGDQTPQGPSRFEWLCSSWGFAYLQQNQRASNDRLMFAPKGNDGHMTPMHGGIPVRRVTGLNEAQVWEKGGSFVAGTEKDADVDGPRYILMDYAAIQTRFHENFNFKRHAVRENPRVIGTQVMPIETWWTVLSMDPRTLGVMSPDTTDIVPPAGV